MYVAAEAELLTPGQQSLGGCSIVVRQDVHTRVAKQPLGG